MRAGKLPPSFLRCELENFPVASAAPHLIMLGTCFTGICYLIANTSPLYSSKYNSLSQSSHSPSPFIIARCLSKRVLIVDDHSNSLYSFCGVVLIELLLSLVGKLSCLEESVGVSEFLLGLLLGGRDGITSRSLNFVDEVLDRVLVLLKNGADEVLVDGESALGLRSHEEDKEGDADVEVERNE